MTMVASLKTFALGLPGTKTGVACEGTALERETVQVGSKTFLFMGGGELKLKLGPNLEEAQNWADDGSAVKTGGSGWVTVMLEKADGPSKKELERWVGESFRLLAPKTLVKQLDEALRHLN